MKFRTLLVMAALAWVVAPIAQAQTCPANTYNLNSQAEVNAFPAGCTQIIRNLNIYQTDAMDPIDDLSPLAGITDVGRNLLIRDTEMVNLDQLAGITSVGWTLQVRNNDDLTSLGGLKNIGSVARSLIIRDNELLVDLDGLQGQSSIGLVLLILNNDDITSLNGLQNVTSVGRDLRIEGNADLTGLVELQNVTSVGRDLRVLNNAALLSLSGLENIASPISRDLRIRNNVLLQNLDALADLTEVGRDFEIRNNDTLTEVSAMASLISVTRNVIVRQNDNLTFCDGLIPLLDAIDDGVAGPGLPPPSTPDVGGTITINSNGGATCVSQQAILDNATAPLLSQAFAPDLVSINVPATAISTLSFTIDNTGPARATGVAFSNTLPATLAIAATPNATHDCDAGMISAPANGAVISFSGGLVAGSGSCTVSVDIVGLAEGTPLAIVNTSGPLAFDLGGSATSSDSITVDDTAPVIIVVGDNPLNLLRGDSFIDPGATATDNVDPSVTVSASDDVDTSMIGNYKVTYTASDSVGNVSTEERLVNVRLRPAPVLSLSTASVDFGSVRLGQISGTETVTVENTGTAVLNISGIEGAAAPFAAAGGTCAVGPLAVGASCTLEYTFSPTVAGAANQALAITSDAASSPDSIALAGTGTESTLVLSVDTVDFGDVLLGQISGTETVTVENTGTAVLNISGIEGAAAPFAAAGGTCAVGPLAVGASCTLEYTFSPTVAGAANQALAITSDAASSPDSLALAGTGTESTLALSVDTVDFGDVLVGQGSAPASVTLSNTGSAALSVSAIDLAAAPFSATGGGTCANAPFQLAVGEQCTLEYLYAPTAEESSSQVLEVSSDSSTDSSNLTLQGNGLAPRRSYSGPLPSGNIGTLTFDTADAGCEFEGDPVFSSGDSSGPPPENLELVDGLVTFVIAGCSTGAAVDLTFDYGADLPMTGQYLKVADPWRQIPAVIDGRRVLFSLTDGGVDDDDGAANGRIVDPSGLVRPVAAPVVPQVVPVNQPLMLLLAMLGLIGLVYRHQGA